MKLMVVLPRVPGPLDKGDKLRAYHQLVELSKCYKLFVYCIAETGTPFSAKETLLEFCEEVHTYKLTRRQSVVGAAACLFTGRPFQAGYFYNAQIHAAIKQQFHRIKPDKILFQLVRTAPYRQGLNAPVTIIDYMDALSEGYKRMGDKLKGIAGLLYKEEARRLKRYEAEVFATFDKHIIISEQDKQLINHPERDAIAVISNGVDTEYFSPVRHQQRYDLLFHGNMNYLPNVDCAMFIASQIVPELKRRGRDVTFLISGAMPNKRVKKLGRRSGIEVTGWLNDVRIAYATSKVFVAPLQLGTGIQNKILEAMAMGLPCVVSPLAANALMLQHNQQVLIGNTVAEYCTHIENLLGNPALGQQLTANALQHVQQNYRWHDNVQKLIKFIA
jgi:sugar transferase (PEP-CTERM/EpsH1 system associated)